jgi:hypothetical protein
MKVTGFTFIRNASKFDYPVVEAVKSILPICDDFIVAVGNSDDDTLELIQGIDKQKIKIIETVWDDSPEMKKGGKVFASETDKAFQAIPADSDWAFYIQGDEVIHEKYLPAVSSSMEKWKEDKSVDGLLFNYLHFYGSYDYVGLSPKWYGHEIRAIKNNKSFYSFRDAQGFRKGRNEKLDVKPVDAYVYHYGWVKEPGTMMKKAINANSFYLEKNFLKKIRSKGPEGTNEFDYSSIDSLKLFTDSHPRVMEDRIRRKNWTFEHDISFNKLSLRYKGKIFIKKYLGINTYYENYRVI